MRFEECRLVGDPCVACGVALVEGVFSKFLPVRPNFFEHGERVPVFFSTHEEFGFEFFEHGNLFFPHRLTELVALTTREVGKKSGEEHDLLLVNGDAVGVFEVFFHHWDIVGDGFKSMFALDEMRDVVHRSRAVEGVHGDKVGEDGGLQFTEVFLHSGTFELEDGDGVASAEELEGFGVVKRNMVNVKKFARSLFDVAQGFLNDGERDEAEEVHFDESDLLDDVSVVLRHDDVFVRLFVLDGGEGCKGVEGVGTDDNTTGVHSDLPDGALELFGVVDGVARGEIRFLVFLNESGGVSEAVFDVDFEFFASAVFEVVGELVRNEVFERIDGRERHVLHASHVGDGVFGGHLPVGDDVGNVCLTIFFGDVVEHPGASLVVEVNVDVGERDAVGVKKTFEEEVVLEGVNVGDAQAVGDDGAGGGATSGADADVKLLAGGTDVVADDEEVAWESHGFHDMEFEVDTFSNFVGDLFVTQDAVRAFDKWREGRLANSIAHERPLPSELFEIVGFEFYAVDFVIAAKVMDFLFGLFL